MGTLNTITRRKKPYMQFCEMVSASHGIVRWGTFHRTQGSLVSWVNPMGCVNLFIRKKEKKKEKKNKTSLLVTFIEE